jgi:hypothetical protein
MFIRPPLFEVFRRNYGKMADTTIRIPIYAGISIITVITAHACLLGKIFRNLKRNVYPYIRDIV